MHHQVERLIINNSWKGKEHGSNCELWGWGSREIGNWNVTNGMSWMCSWEIPSFLLIYRLNEILFFFWEPLGLISHMLKTSLVCRNFVNWTLTCRHCPHGNMWTRKAKILNTDISPLCYARASDLEPRSLFTMVGWLVRWLYTLQVSSVVLLYL